MASTDAVHPLNADEEHLLRLFAQVWTALPRAMDADLVRERGMPMGEYFMLMHLSEAPGRRLRMSDLATATTMSLSGTSRAVQRVERECLVRRERAGDDGRVWHAVLTDAGMARLEECWPTHLTSVRRHFFDHLAAADRRGLLTALTRVGRALRHDDVAPSPAGEA